MCFTFSAQSSRVAAWSSYDVHHVSAQNNLSHVSAQNSWKVVQSSFDVCHVSSSEPLESSSE